MQATFVIVFRRQNRVAWQSAKVWKYQNTVEDEILPACLGLSQGSSWSDPELLCQYQHHDQLQWYHRGSFLWNNW